MLARQRQAFILDRVREDGAVRVADLVRELGVSDMTVHRDLEILDDRGLLEKVHGGATAVAGSSLFEPGFRAMDEPDKGAKIAVANSRAPDKAFLEAQPQPLAEIRQALFNVPELAPSDSAELHAEALARLLDDPKLRRRMGEEGRQTALDLYAWPRVAAKLEAYYTDLLAGEQPVWASAKSSLVS